MKLSDTVRGLTAAMQRYGVASMSSALVSLAHLLVQISGLRALDLREVGLLAFLITILQLGFSLSNAAVCAPYGLAINGEGRTDRARITSLLHANYALAIAYAVICGVVAGWSAGLPTGLGFGVATFLLMLRWFGRADAYAHHAPMRAALSDIAYSAALFGGICIGLFTPVTLGVTALWFAAAGVLGLVPLLGSLRLPRGGPSGGAGLFAAAKAYRPVWREQSSWALVGVVTTEATANGHAYLVVLLAGPTAFAPIAIGALFMRPLGVCMNALAQMERPRMAREIATGAAASAVTSARHFAMAMAAIWVGTVMLAAIILLLVPHLVVKSGTDMRVIALAVVLNGALALVQAMQTPWNVLLQAANLFRPLALTSLRACLVSLLLVLAILFLAPPLWSIAGVLVGQLVMLIGILSSVAAWRAGLRPLPQSPTSLDGTANA